MMWQSFDDQAPEEVQLIAECTAPPILGQHVGKTFTLSDGRWLVLKFAQTSSYAESYFILPAPPQGPE